MGSAAQITCMLITRMLIFHLLIQSLPRGEVSNYNSGFVYLSFYVVHPNALLLGVYTSVIVLASCKVDHLLFYNAALHA